MEITELMTDSDHGKLSSLNIDQVILKEIGDIVRLVAEDDNLQEENVKEHYEFCQLMLEMVDLEGFEMKLVLRL